MDILKKKLKVSGARGENAVHQYSSRRRAARPGPPPSPPWPVRAGTATAARAAEVLPLDAEAAPRSAAPAARVGSVEQQPQHSGAGKAPNDGRADASALAARWRLVGRRGRGVLGTRAAPGAGQTCQREERTEAGEELHDAAVEVR